MTKQERNTALMKAVGKRLREIREARGLSQEKVQFEKNLYVSYIENGLRNISISTLTELCELYGITVKEFFKDWNDEETASQ